VASSLVVRSERVVFPDGVRAAAIHVHDGRIVNIAPHSDDHPSGVRELDAGELMVLPGLVDTHVHMNDPGRTHWEGADHATCAAAAGGVTTLIDMPLNSVPATTAVSGLQEKHRALRDRCYVDVGFWGGVVPGNIEALEPLAGAGVLGFKCFLCPSGVDEFEHVTARDLREALPVIARLGLPLLAHAELPEHLRDPDDGDPRSYATWLHTRPPEAEHAAIDLLIGLAVEYHARIHIVHLASSGTVPAMRAARAGGVPITVETCPHYLAFAAEEIGDGATSFKCAPPVRDGGNRERLWQALIDRDIDLIATDHSPAPPAMKSIDDGDFLRAWGGIASLQLGLAVVWTGARDRGIGIEQIARWMCDAPARLAGLSGVKGSIAVGADADLILWDPDARSVVNPAELHHRHPITPYAGMELSGLVRTTLLRGQIVYKDGEVMPGIYGRMIGTRS
jgi:allantoinase